MKFLDDMRRKLFNVYSKEREGKSIIELSSYSWIHCMREMPMGRYSLMEFFREYRNYRTKEVKDLNRALRNLQRKFWKKHDPLERYKKDTSLYKAEQTIKHLRAYIETLQEENKKLKALKEGVPDA